MPQKEYCAYNFLVLKEGTSSHFGSAEVACVYKGFQFLVKKDEEVVSSLVDWLCVKD